MFMVEKMMGKKDAIPERLMAPPKTVRNSINETCITVYYRVDQLFLHSTLTTQVHGVILVVNS